MMLQFLRLRSRSVDRLVILAGLTAALGIWSDPAGAALLVYEPFDYPGGTILHTTPASGQNLTDAYQSLDPGLPNQFQLSARTPGLDYGSLSGVPTPGGNLLTQSQGTTANAVTVEVDEDVAIDPGQTIYWSTLFSFDDSANGNHRASVTFTNGDNGDVLHFGEPIVGIRGVRVEADTAATGGLIADGADGSFENGDTLLVVGRYINSAAVDGDRLDLLGYNTADADLLPATFDPADPNAEFAYQLSGLDIDMAKITSITFTIRGTDNHFIDELRIGTTYASVGVPEPAAIWLAVSGMVGGMGSLSRNRR